jgi:hypothetical protein
MSTSAPAPENHHDVESTAQFQELLSADLERISVIYFWAPWAEPCKQTDPVVLELARKHPKLLALRVEAEEQAWERDERDGELGTRGWRPGRAAAEQGQSAGRTRIERGRRMKRVWGLESRVCAGVGSICVLVAKKVSREAADVVGDDVGTREQSAHHSRASPVLRTSVCHLHATLQYLAAFCPLLASHGARCQRLQASKSRRPSDG